MAGDTGYQLHFHRLESQRIENYDRIGQLLQRRLPHLAALHRLPPDPDYFTGRQSEIDDITDLLKQSWIARQSTSLIVSIAGRAGVGKSALAIHIAHQVKRDLNTQLYINLRGTDSQPLAPTEALASLLRAWGIEDAAIPESLEARSHLFQSVLANKRVVLVLDNAADEAQVSPLISLDASHLVLITSRKRFTKLEPVAPIDLAEMSEAEALELLQKLAGNAIDPADIETGIRTVNLCSRLPLSLSLVGTLLRQQSDLSFKDCLEQLIEERARLKLLHLSHPDVRASFTLSYKALDPIAAHLLRLIGLLTETTFDLTVATVLLDAEPEALQQAIDMLVNLKLITRGADSHYTITHDLIRLLIRGQLATEEPSGTRQIIRFRLSRWYLETVKLMNLILDASSRSQLTLAVSRQTHESLDATEQNLLVGAFNWFETERINLLGAVEWLYQVEAWDLVLSLTENLVRFLDQRTYWMDWETTHRMALDAARQLGDRAREAYMLNNLGNVYMRRGNWERAKERYEHSLEILRDIKDVTREAQTLSNLGILWALQQQQERAIVLWNTALTKLPVDAPEQKRIRRWIQSSDQLSLEKASIDWNNRANHRNILKTLGGMIKRLIQE